MGSYKGYILTRERLETGDTHRLRYCGTTGDHPFEIIITNNRPLFFIHRDVPSPIEIFHCERRSVDLMSFEGRPVDALYFKTQSLLYKARKYYENHEIQTFEADVYPEERYLMERFIHGGVEIDGPHRLDKGVLVFVNPRIRAIDYEPVFSVLSLDIETGQKGELYSIACHFSCTSPENKENHPSDYDGVVLMVDEKKGKEQNAPFSLKQGPCNEEGEYDFELLPEGGRLYRMASEKDLLKALLEVFDKMDPHIIIGWHVIGFDLLFLERKFKELGLPFGIGRGGRIPVIREVRKGIYRVEISGRVIIDGPHTLRGAFYSFDNFKLETVAVELLGTGKDIGGDQDKVSEIERRFREDKKSLAYYNLQDCRLVSQIFEKTGLIDHVFKRAIISGLPMDRIGMSVAAFDHFMLPHVHRKGVVAINTRDVKSMGHAKGGFVFSKEPGFYENVIVLDFKSLYPSIIMTFKIDPVSRLNANKDPLSTPVGITFSRTLHVLPGYIEKLMGKREIAKKAHDPHLSQAIKILMNSFYGVMGTSGCRFYHQDLPTAITGTGQWILKTTRDYMERDGYQVIYGDTDSVFVCLKDSELYDCDKSARKLVSKLNSYMTQKLDADFGVKSRLELEFEKHFIRFFLPSLRGGGSSAKKRYAGMIKKDGKEELVLTGLEFVRSDWTRFARDFQYELFQRIFHDQEVEKWLKKKVTDLNNHVYDKDLVYKKRMTKPPREYIKVVPPHVKAALLMGKAGENLKESRYVMTMRGPVPVELPHADLDYNHYIEKQLKPIFDAVMMFFDRSFNEIVRGRQLTLF